MPPSRHSSSSHSSHSSGSSRSSSSRSSGSSSRSPSSHSYSSHSSRSSYSTRSSSPSYRAPSRHSSGSRSGTPIIPAWAPDPTPAQRRETVRRERRNQPGGFEAATRRKPSFYDGLRHSWAYYPESWVDRETGESHEKGYYDETGRRCDSVAFKSDGKYQNVVCRCPYCETDTILDLSADDPAGLSLKCPNCGGPMSLVSELDELSARPTENTHDYDSEASLREFYEKPKRKKRGCLLWFLAALAALVGLYSLGVRQSGPAEPAAPANDIQSIQLIQQEDRLCLRRVSSGVYEETDSVGRWDKRLEWDADAESYYDAESDCWLWYNTEVDPPLWQYWYEGISSDYGDYGWMEHEESGWYIEASEGRWIALPARYDAAALWYIR